MKIFIRTLRNQYRITYWANEADRDHLRRALNESGFYVLTGVGDSLDVFAIKKREDYAMLQFIDHYLFHAIVAVYGLLTVWVGYQLFLGWARGDF